MKHVLRIVLFILLLPAPVWAQSGLPDPQLVITSVETYTANGRTFRRYKFDVANKAAFPAAMFAAAPALPPCGNNHNSSRTWVDFFRGDGARLYGFCALGTPSALGNLWFALPVEEMPPASVTIVMTDRQTNIRYRSNAVSLTAEALMARAEALPPADWRASLGLGDLALQVRFAGAAIDMSWYVRFRRLGLRGGIF